MFVGGTHTPMCFISVIAGEYSKAASSLALHYISLVVTSSRVSFKSRTSRPKMVIKRWNHHPHVSWSPREGASTGVIDHLHDVRLSLGGAGRYKGVSARTCVSYPNVIFLFSTHRIKGSDTNVRLRVWVRISWSPLDPTADKRGRTIGFRIGSERWCSRSGTVDHSRSEMCTSALVSQELTREEDNQGSFPMGGLPGVEKEGSYNQVVCLTGAAHTRGILANGIARHDALRPQVYVVPQDLVAS